MTKQHLEDSIHAFQDTAIEQENKGIAKYGKPLDPIDDYDWLDMAAEELVDGFKYLIAEKKKRQYIVSSLRTLIGYVNGHPFAIHEINKLLDELEGKSKGGEDN